MEIFIVLVLVHYLYDIINDTDAVYFINFWMNSRYSCTLSSIFKIRNKCHGFIFFMIWCTIVEKNIS